MKGCSRKSSDRDILQRAILLNLPSMKGCSRKSSDTAPAMRTPVRSSLNERLLPKEQRPVSADSACLISSIPQ